MARLLLAVLLTLVPLAAMAQDAEDSADATSEQAAEQVYTAYDAANYGFTVELPEGGRIDDPSTEGWTEEEQVAFRWLSDGTAPVDMIIGRVDKFQADIDDDMFNVFCDTLLENWSDEAKYTVVTSNRRINIDPLTWNLIEVEDNKNPDSMEVYYSVFSMYSGSTVYSITMYYLESVSDEIQAFGIPVVYSFDLTE